MKVLPLEKGQSLHIECLCLESVPTTHKNAPKHSVFNYSESTICKSISTLERPSERKFNHWRKMESRIINFLSIEGVDTINLKEYLREKNDKLKLEKGVLRLKAKENSTSSRPIFSLGNSRLLKKRNTKERRN